MAHRPGVALLSLAFLLTACGCDSTRSANVQQRPASAVQLAEHNPGTCGLCVLYPDARRYVVRVHSRKGQGAGVVISDQGYVLTNAHVVAGVDDPVIETHDGSVYLARVLQTDADADLALLRIETEGARWFAVPIDSGERVPVGTKVFAIGHPIGLGWTVTQGIVSAHRRAGEVAPVQLIQTDAATSPGNSGGPLLDEQGHLIGIISAKLVSLSIENVTFAIPTSVVRPFLERGFKGRVDSIPGSTQHDHR